MACIIASWVPTASITEWAPTPVGEVLDLGHAGVAALGDDVGGAVGQRQLLPGLVAAHGDDAFRAELLCGFHAAVRPKVRPADAGRCEADDGISRFHNGRLRPLLDPDVAGGMQDSHTHDQVSPSSELSSEDQVA
jgi:hypothetical protein